MADKRVAVLLDLGFVQKRLYSLLGKKQPTAKQILAFAKKCVIDGEELFRLYFYDCRPFGGILVHPMSRVSEDFSTTPVFKARSVMLDEIARAEHVALRQGVLSCDGWKLKRRSQDELLKTPRACAATDFEPDFKQKRVDMKIGLDVAWLSSKGIVEKIVLVTADTDFIPAMKFARREGVQVVIVPMSTRMLNKVLLEHADEVRNVKP